MSFIAVAMASGGADLSDETRTAVGPSTIYAYLLVGGLFNLVLVEDFPTRVAGLVLYGVRRLGVLAGGRRAGRRSAWTRRWCGRAGCALRTARRW